ncbi:RNA polymerase II C-terminal domain phosphatase-like 4 [Sarracenia purpurea var. burkii]
MRMLTKLRPFVRTFLKEASNLFEMYIYTMGERSYALEMANLLDPGKVYFSSRVIAQDDSTKSHQKGLDVVLGQESAVLILDDTEPEESPHNIHQEKSRHYVMVHTPSEEWFALALHLPYEMTSLDPWSF